MVRSTLQVLEILEVAADAGIAVHVVKQDMVFAGTPDMTNTIMATVLGLAAQIEREFVSQRTKEALAARKQAGMQTWTREIFHTFFLLEIDQRFP
jgi:DNA invertase Pin-like site-specific DNA recombinase